MSAERISRQPVPSAFASEYARAKSTDLSAREIDVVKTHKEFVVQQLEMPADPDRFATNRPITFECYLPQTPGPHPAVLVLPISGGGYQVERLCAKYFARHNLAAVLVHRRKLDPAPKTGEATNALLKQSVLDAKRVIDWIETQPDFDARRIGVFGASIGGIRGALLAPLDDRVQAAVLGLVGGDLGYVFAHTREPGYARERQAVLRERHLTITELEQELRATLTWDPLTLAPCVDREKVLLVLALCDRVVPFKKGWALREKMGKPETLIVPTGHFTAALYLPYIERQSVRFFRKRFTTIR